MKIISIITTSFLALGALTASAQKEEKLPKDVVLLDAIKKKNAGIEVEEPQISNFDTTLFTIGRIQSIPANRTVISSRIAGRVISTPPIVGDLVKEGETILKVESRQPGSPPPIIPVKATSSGMVFKSHTTLGEPVEPSEELMDIIDISKVWAVADIPESKAAQIKLGQTAYIKIFSIGETIFKGKLIRFGTEADADAGTIKAIFLIDNPDLKIRPNMLTEFNIVISTREKVFSVPKSAIQGDKLNAHIFKRYFDLKYAYKKVPVVIGQTNRDRVEIILQNKELNLHDVVVTNGGYLLSHTTQDKGSLVKALDEAHGHKHNPDGSEITGDQKAAGGADGSAEQGASSTERILLYATNGILLLLLIFTIFRKNDIS